MADDKSGRDKQARDADRRQRERAIVEELERQDETEPPVETAALDDIEAELESLEFPATGAETVAAVGDREIESGDGTYEIRDLVPDTDAETFDAPDDVRRRVQRPTIAATMKRIVEANEANPNADFGASQREAYEKTLRALKTIDADDDDEGVRVVGDWILERIRDEGEFPGSRAVRRKGAEFCRSHGYQVRNDEWLGV